MHTLKFTNARIHQLNIAKGRSDTLRSLTETAKHYPTNFPAEPAAQNTHKPQDISILLKTSPHLNI